MNVAVWDTYVTKKDGVVMHFDIIVPASMQQKETIYKYGKQYLDSKGLTDLSIVSNTCTFCHVASIKMEWEAAINQNGYYIYEMENCG